MKRYVRTSWVAYGRALAYIWIWLGGSNEREIHFRTRLWLATSLHVGVAESLMLAPCRPAHAALPHPLADPFYPNLVIDLLLTAPILHSVYSSFKKPMSAFAPMPNAQQDPDHPRLALIVLAASRCRGMHVY
jgi:hypothetical protein